MEIIIQEIPMSLSFIAVIFMVVETTSFTEIVTNYIRLEVQFVLCLRLCRCNVILNLNCMYLLMLSTPRLLFREMETRRET